jgi:hypothetical protein
MSPTKLGPSMVFFIFSGLSVLGSMYCFFVLKESRGLPDKEKKLLFTPRKYILMENDKQLTNKDRETSMSKLSDGDDAATDSERPTLVGQDKLILLYD